VGIKAFIDESGTHQGSPIICLAGYLIYEDQLIDLESEWLAVMQTFNLPHFHMVDCAHGNGEFAKLSKAERIDCQTRCIEIIRRRTFVGFSVSVNEADFDEIYRPLSRDNWSAYYFCLTSCLSAVVGVLRGSNITERVSFVLEAGHRDQRMASRTMRELFSSSVLQAQYQYGSHEFRTKREAVPLQAADLLAWHWYTDKKRGDRRRPRADLVELLRPKDVCMDYTRRHLKRLSIETRLYGRRDCP
jgi:hypothetical protein